MNIKKVVTFGFGAALALGAAACDPADLTEVNQNPNNPTDAPSTALFTAATRNAAGTWLGTLNLRGFELLAQHLAEVQYPESDQYLRLRRSSTSNTFNNSYNVELQDLELIIARANEASNAAQYGPAEVMRAWIFFNLTDTYGDVPYSEAFQAADGVLQPAYDTQESIYADLFARLDRVSTAMGSASGTGFGDSDPIYAGDLASWRRFANSLRARQALRVVNVDPALANTQLTAAFSAAGGLIETNAQNAEFAWPGDGVYDNPWATNFKTRDDHRLSEDLTILLENTGDPRATVFGQPAEQPIADIPGQLNTYCAPGGDCFGGLANALTHANASTLFTNTSRPGEIFYPGVTSYGTFGGSGGSYPSYLMTAAEVAFIKAEAAERGLGGLTPAQAAGFYQQGITLSMQQWGVTSAAAIAAYLADADVVYVPGTEGLRRIARQKWLALFSDGLQAWMEFRRTCEPSTIVPGPAAISNIIPRRLQYSLTEQTVNSTNLAAAVAELPGGDTFAGRMWWDTEAAHQSAPTFFAGCGVRP